MRRDQSPRTLGSRGGYRCSITAERSVSMTDGGRKVRFEEMFPWEIAAAIADAPLCYLPLGALEWHGEHAAVGLDALKAHAVGIRAADRSGGLVAPLYWSIAHNIAAIRETGEVFRREHPKSGW